MVIIRQRLLLECLRQFLANVAATKKIKVSVLQGSQISWRAPKTSFSC